MSDAMYDLLFIIGVISDLILSISVLAGILTYIRRNNGQSDER